MLLPEILAHFLERHQLRNARLLVAVSGGVDSVVLAQSCVAAGVDCIFVHANFGLRGEESERDEAFVRRLGEEWGRPVMVKHFDTEEYARRQRLSIQEAARNLRYDWFREVMADTGARCVLLAHHADDNIETVLMNFFRGTGLEGLTGIKEISPDGAFGRPLLAVGRNEIEAYARGNDLRWVEDSSNRSNQYTRNFFRNEILPLVRQAYPEAEANIIDNIGRFQQVNALYQTFIGELRKKLCVPKGAEVWMPVKLLQKHWQPALVYELIKPFGFNEKQVGGLFQLLTAGSGRYLRNASWQIVKHRAWLVIAPLTEAASTLVIDRDTSSVVFQNGRLHVEIREGGNFIPGDDPATAWLDAKDLSFPLLLRPWKEGDYFYPLGLRKKKKLARFFIDNKLSKPQKEKVWVVESNRRIVWVIGLRIDDRFRITPNTKSALIITWQHHIVG